MQLIRYPKNPILSKNPKNPWEAGSVFNPSVIYENEIFHMFYRATNDIKTKTTGRYISSIGYAKSNDGIHFERSSDPIIKSDEDYEIGLGCEDPRVTRINDTYFLFYTAVKVKNGNKEVRIALATSKDLVKWKKHGVIGPATRSKAAALFPEKIDGNYLLFYTFMPDRPTSSIMMAKFSDLNKLIKTPNNFMSENLNHYEENVVFSPPLNVYRGAEVGAVPIKTKYGWLFIYCPANLNNFPQWSINAALLDLKNPKKILKDIEILKPETHEEINGVVNNVTFPEGAVIVGDQLYVYYGSGDQGICLATCKLDELFKALGI